MESIFLNYFAPDAKAVKISDNENLSFYQTLDSLFILADTSKTGLITKEIKQSLNLKECFSNKNIYFVNLFNDRSEMKNFNEEIAWGSYAWFKNAPSHHIHFDDTPSKLFVHKIETTN
jgi:hypothetical protein